MNRSVGGGDKGFRNIIVIGTIFAVLGLAAAIPSLLPGNNGGTIFGNFFAPVAFVIAGAFLVFAIARIASGAAGGR